ncbi:MAG TPA: tetratricopeptide repeat protein [Armatimonadota bacterium]
MPKYSQETLATIQRDYQAGRECADAGQLEDALPFFDRVLGHLPRRRRDRLYRIEGGRAVPGDPGVLWLPPVFREALLAKVFCLNQLGRFADASVLLQRALELDPENPTVYTEIGFAHGELDNLPAARRAYAYAAELEPQNPAHWRALTHLALVAEEYEEAHAFALHAVTLDPDSVHALHQLAFARYRLGQMEGAIAVLERAVEIDPDDRESILRLAGTLREAGRIRLAIARTAAYLLRHDTDPEVLGVMSDLLQQDGTAPELFAHAERLLARNPRDPDALDLLAWGYYQHGRVQESLEVLRRLVAFEPMQAHHHFKLGLIYETLGNLPLAMASLLRSEALAHGEEVGVMAREAVQNLDQVQIEQVIARAEADIQFRYRLQHDPAQAMLHAGYLLSPRGFHMLQSFDLSRERIMGVDTRPRTIH